MYGPKEKNPTKQTEAFLITAYLITKINTAPQHVTVTGCEM